jgi:hypothetical protein
VKSRPFDEARKFVRTLGLKTSKEWVEYCKSGNKPVDIPYSPYRVYNNDWKGWGDWLGNVTPREIEFRPFDEAKEFVHSLELKSREEWDEYCKSGNKPVDIPAYPNQRYKKEWKGFGDWLGTNSLSNKEKHKQMQPFTKAREFVHSLGLKNAREWEKYRKSEKKPVDIPANPNVVYEKEWDGIGDWLGTGTIAS